METNSKSKVVPQLKKSDFSSVVTDEPMSREELVNALTDFAFLPSYLDYLIDHFCDRKVIVKNDDGTVQRRVGKSIVIRTLFRVVKETTAGEGENEDDVYCLEKCELSSGEYFDDEAKQKGWALTKNAAVKKVCSKVYREYKETTATIRELLSE